MPRKCLLTAIPLAAGYVFQYVNGERIFPWWLLPGNSQHAWPGPPDPPLPGTGPRALFAACLPAPGGRR